jgi:phosphohistidine phosphatase
MDLYLIRHAIAAEPVAGQRDSERPLTARGRERFARAVHGMRELGITFGRVIHSPWKRAVQTAELLGPLNRGAFEASAALAAEPSSALLQVIAEAKVRSLALVGHQPWLAELGVWLLTGKRQRVEMLVIKRGGMAWLEGEPEPGRMQLRALWTPRSLRAIGR